MPSTLVEDVLARPGRVLLANHGPVVAGKERLSLSQQSPEGKLDRASAPSLQSASAETMVLPVR